jgi:hypothetical protein
MAGEFAQLLPFVWRGQHLPLTRIHVSLAHDLVEHKYWGVDGARVEDTGVAPLRIAAVIPISNSIFPGSKEQWAAGKLYPHALRTFITQFAKRATGKLQHPEFGEIACKAERLDFELVGDRQDSTEIHASWVETIDDETKALLDRIIPSPVSDLGGAAADLTASGADLKALVPQLPEFKEDIESLGRKLTGIVDQVSILSYRQAGVVNRILYQAHRMELSIKRAKSALTWPAVNNLQRIKSAAYSLRRELLKTTGIGLYTVPAATTLAGVSLALPAKTSIGEVIKLNPSLVRGPVVPKGALVRYPLAA